MFIKYIAFLVSSWIHMAILIVCASDSTKFQVLQFMNYVITLDRMELFDFCNLAPFQCSFIYSNIFHSFVQVNPFRCQLRHFRRCSEIYLPNQTFYTRTTSIKASVADHNEPNEVKIQIGIMKEKLKEALPSPVQEFPWRKAQHTLLDRLHLLAQEALKWSSVVYFISSSLSDVIYTFSINRELIIPVGLFVGVLVADFLKEISLELFHQSEVYVALLFHCSTIPFFYYIINDIYCICSWAATWQENDLKWCRLGLCGIFVLVKFMSTWFATLPGVFLLHVANGGLMQLLWYWRNFMEDAKIRQKMNTPSGLEA